MNILCLDVGRKKIGVAIASTFIAQARPLGLIEVRPGWQRQLQGVIKQWQIQSVLLGDPGQRSENNPVQELLATIETQLEQLADITVQRWPEDYSSQEARLEQDSYPEQSLDAIAAMLVLQAYLDSR